ncbi:LIPOPROTEIN [Mycoplasmopsis pulmonis]|uniref:LIPOPROTEIN n=1 Tax=Mycoplasmopsis pulmonis (strain UAB CTIP) TaxID=272635 RepID=Q98RI4_MYCPU|nr:thermonuclease family protein [Mycoplasmopsis pulmonis]MDZ7293726.1 thermonuclease family protein [Mycoplasmopsis pulmonis]CAC13198.1 LIPOPROTEIN [Mycoplasmopsis pulmonis]VEU67817.1 Uncharacterized lipoprotein MG186 homolog precursor [Mycoplasmopsis pulmonis]
MKKRTLFLILSLTSIALLPSVFISCSHSTEAKLREPKLNFNVDVEEFKNNHPGFEVYDGEMASYGDGDTFVVNLYRNPKNPTRAFATKIRIQLIDTPESSDINKDGKYSEAEKKWGKKASDKVKELIPLNSKVRVFLSGAKTYDREVGTVFFGENFSRNFSVEMINAGLARPNGIDFLKTQYENPKHMANFLAIELAYAFNSAINNKRGMFSDYPTWQETMKKVFVERGTGTAVYDNLFVGKANSIFKYENKNKEK